jgi:hypothetical protein
MAQQAFARLAAILRVDQHDGRTHFAFANFLGIRIGGFGSRSGSRRAPQGGLLVYPLDFFTRIALESNTVLVRTGADQDADHLAHRSAAAWANRIFMLFRHAAVPCQLGAERDGLSVISVA